MSKLFVGVVVGGWALVAGAAGAQHADVLLQADGASGRIVTGSYDDGSGMVISTDERVFGADFGEADPGQPNYADEPGFRALVGTFAPSAAWGVDITDAVRVWDALGGNFDAISAHTISLGFGPLRTTSPTTAGGFTPASFTLMVDANGGVHQHLDIYLDAPTDGAPVDGIYLLRLSAFATGWSASDDFWFVMNRGADEAEHDRAIDYVREFIVPAPATGAVLMLAAMGARRRRPMAG